MIYCPRNSQELTKWSGQYVQRKYFIPTLFDIQLENMTGRCTVTKTQTNLTFAQLASTDLSYITEFERFPLKLYSWGFVYNMGCIVESYVVCKCNKSIYNLE